MAAAVRYEPDQAGTNRLMNGPAMVELMRQRAEAAKTYAISISPKDTGHYAASFVVEAHAHGGPSRDRAEAILRNIAAYAADVEWHNENGRVLGRTVDYIERG